MEEMFDENRLASSYSLLARFETDGSLVMIEDVSNFIFTSMLIRKTTTCITTDRDSEKVLGTVTDTFRPRCCEEGRPSMPIEQY